MPNYCDIYRDVLSNIPLLLPALLQHSDYNWMFFGYFDNPIIPLYEKQNYWIIMVRTNTQEVTFNNVKKNSVASILLF